MTDNRLGRAWLRVAVVYFVVAVMLGIVMGASGNHTLMPVHAHLNLLGWVSMSLFGLIGAACPAVSRGLVATVQFWLHNLGVPVMLGALAFRLEGYAGAEPVVGLASVVVGVSAGLFAWLVWTRVGTAHAVGAAQGTRP